MASAIDWGLSLAAGSLTTLSPCVFPVLPLVLGSAMQSHRAAPLAMGAGMVVTFALAGTALGLLGPALGIDADTLRTGGAALMVLFGLGMLVPGLDALWGRLLAPLSGAAHQASRRWGTNSLWGAAAVGSLLGLVWSPCSGPLLASALTLVASKGSALQGGLLLGLFGAGAALPLVLVAYASGHSVRRGRDWMAGRMQGFKKGFGLLLLLVGVAILSGADKWLEARILDALPDWWIGLSVRY